MIWSLLPSVDANPSLDKGRYNLKQLKPFTDFLVGLKAIAWMTFAFLNKLLNSQDIISYSSFNRFRVAMKELFATPHQSW
jgi:hypothetical protein